MSDMKQMVEEMVLEKNQLMQMQEQLRNVLNSILGTMADDKGIVRIPKAELAKAEGYIFEIVEFQKSGSLKITGSWNKEE
jgi:regulator of replication initiation timing